MQEDVFPRAQGCAPEEPAPGGAEPEPLPPAQAEQMVQLGGVTAAKGRHVIHCLTIIGQIEDLEYDYLEISSPGVDRPLKRERDFEKARGETVEVKLYKAQDGAKVHRGELVGLVDGEVVLQTEAGEKRFARKACALVQPVIEYEDIEEEEKP